MRKKIQSVAVIGAGPAGASLAAYLAREGVRVALFDSAPESGLVVGESLVPAIVPFLRELGIEAEVASYSIRKPGATFTMPNRSEQMHFRFDEVRKARTSYSYNVPRDRFDASIRAAALAAGARRFPIRAQVDRGGDDALRLSAETLERTEGFLNEQPDWVVDASGRNRLAARRLGLPSESGQRRDTALFAHMEGIELDREGHVHTCLLEHGWSWRIPLPGRVSVGLVVAPDALAKFGDGPDQQFDTLLRHDPVTRVFSEHAKRLSPVSKYTNYQMRTLRGVGANWALVGDAFGFIDPVFSGGALIALDSAFELARAIRNGGDRAFRRYERHVLRHLHNWHRAVGHFYDGRLFTLFRVGNVMRETPPGRLMEPHFIKHLPRVFTGEATSGRYSVGLLNFMCEYGLARNDPAQLAVR